MSELREVVARIIDPEAFERAVQYGDEPSFNVPGWAIKEAKSEVAEAYSKADAILLALGQEEQGRSQSQPVSGSVPLPVTEAEPSGQRAFRGSALDLASAHGSIVGWIRAYVSPVHHKGDPPGYWTITGEDEAAEAIIEALAARFADTSERSVLTPSASDTSEERSAPVCSGCGLPATLGTSGQCRACDEEDRDRADEDWFFDKDGKP